MSRSLFAVLGFGLAACQPIAVAPTSPTGTAPSTDPEVPAGTVPDDPGDEPAAGEASWLATYDLTGSEFYVRASVDFTVTVEEPYADDLRTGPGRVILRFPDRDGEMVAGDVQLVEYQLVWDFVTGVGGFADVHTALDNQAGPEACGLASGPVDGGAIRWEVPEIEVCQDGQISCSGPFCGVQGSPEEGQPEVVSGCAPWAIHPFRLAPDLSSFEMDPAIVSDEDGNQTAMMFRGTLVDATREEAAPCD